MTSSTHLVIVTLMMPQGTTGVQTHINAIAQYATAQGVPVSLVHPFRFNRWLRKIPGAIVRILNGISRERAVLAHRFFVRRILKSLLRGVLVAKQGKPVVVYAQDPLSASVALDLRQEGYPFRLVAVVHFNISEAQEYVAKGIARENGKLWDSLMRCERDIFPRLDQVIFVSDFLRRKVGERMSGLCGIPQAVISNFVVTPCGTAASVDQVTGDLICIGTLEARKNQAYLLEVLAACNSIGRCFSLTMVGDGPERAQLEKKVQRLGLTSQVRMLGYQPDAASLIPLHKAFVHASTMESQGIVLLEALRAAVPVFAAPVGGIPEVFSDGQEGHYLSLDDPREAAEKLISVLDNPTRWQSLSENARASYAMRFHPDILGKRWINALLGG